MTDTGGLYQCITDISRADTTGDYQKALQAANKLIRKYPKETFAFKCKLVALIQLSCFDDALQLIKKTPSHQMGDVSFEKAYIFYRRGELDAALEVLKNCDEKDVRAMELRAQIYYKQENFKSAAAIFEQLMDNYSDDSDELRRANYLAVQARLESEGVAQALNKSDDDSYSQLYNKACVQIEAENYEEAVESLDKSLEMCREALIEEDREDYEIKEELDSIRVQKAYALQKMGKIKEAQEIYDNLELSNHKDDSLRATIINNLPSISSKQSGNATSKQFKNVLKIDQSKLTNRQRRTLMLNYCLVLLYANQREPCRKALEDVINNFGKSKDVILAEAALYVSLKNNEKALEMLKSSNDFELQLAALHILLNSSKFEDGVQMIRKMLKHDKLSITSLLISTLIAMNKKEEALNELKNALKNVNNKKPVLECLYMLEEESGNYSEAIKHAEELKKITPNDQQLNCKLVYLYSKVDQAKAEQLCNQILPDEIEGDGMDLDELEESDWILYGEKYRMKKEAKGEQSPQNDNAIITRTLKNQKRKKRKIRLPKNYDPNVAPDPERWLPKQERTAYKKKRKNREREVGRGTQGSSSANPNVEYMANSPNSPRPLPGPVAEGPRQQRPNFQKQKKKKSSKF